MIGVERFAVPFAKGLVFRPGSDQFLLQRRVKPGDTYFGFWEVPGGRIREGESVLDGLAREVREETGIVEITWLGQADEVLSDRFGGRVRALSPLATVEILHHSRPVFGHYFVGETREQPVPTEEARDHRWVTPEQFRQEFLEVSSDERQCTTVDAMALRILLEGRLAELLETRDRGPAAH